jgi:hypothetical protein
LHFFKACPPSGLLLDGGIWLGDFGINGCQICTLYQKGQAGFGTAFAFVVGLTIFCQFAFLQYAAPTGRLIDPVKKSLAARRLENALAGLLNIEKGIEAPGSAFIGGYGASLISDLTVTQASLAVLSLLLSAESVAGMVFTRECGCSLGTEEVLRCRKPLTMPVMFILRCLMALGFFASFIVASHTTHPAFVLIILLFMLIARITLESSVSAEQDNPYIDSAACIVTFLNTASWIFLWFSSVFSAKIQFDGHHSILVVAWPHILMLTLRTLALTALCVGVSLPDGLISFWTLGRPMGVIILRPAFLDPTLMVFSNTFDNDMSMTYPTACFRMFLLLAAVVGVAVELLFHLFELVFLPSYCLGKADEDLMEEGKKKEAEIDAWCEAQEREAKEGRYDLLAFELVLHMYES